MAAAPKYLTGDSAGIKEFIDKFDVSDFQLLLRTHAHDNSLTKTIDFLVRLRWLADSYFFFKI